MPSEKLDIRGVIFDLDGTLADTLRDIADSMNRVLESKGLPVHSYTDYKIFVGRGLRNLTVQSLPENLRSEESINKAFQEMFEDYSQNCLVETSLYDGIPQLLDEMTSRGIKMAVLSNKADELTQIVVESLMGRWNFEKIIGASDYIPAKPDPKGAEIIIESFNAPRKNILYVGDTGTDMLTAVATHLFPVGVTWGFRSANELIEKGARVLVDHPAEIFEIVE